MVQEEQKIIRLISEPLKIAGFDLVEVKVCMLKAQKKIQLYIDSPNSIQIDDCINVNQITKNIFGKTKQYYNCLLYTSPSPRDRQKSRMPSSA